MSTIRDKLAILDSVAARDKLLYWSSGPTMDLGPVRSPYNLAINPDMLAKTGICVCSRTYYAANEFHLDALLLNQSSSCYRTDGLPISVTGTIARH